MKRLLMICFVAAAFVSCTREPAETFDAAGCINGHIYWGGDPQVDGLGWYFMGETELKEKVKLKNLSAEYQQDKLAVSVCLEKTDEKYYCMCVKPLDVYLITSIRKR